MLVNNVEMKKITIECSSPVHIGNSQTLKSFEYLYNSDKQEVLFISRAAWIKFLYRHNLMDDFADYIDTTAAQLAQDGQFKGIMPWQWLKDKDISEEELESLASRRSFATVNILNNGQKESLNDIAVNMSLADGNPYIPGSSIKGALRTAILYKLLNNPKNKMYRFNCWETLESINNLSAKESQKAMTFLENELLAKMKVGYNPNSRYTYKPNHMINSTMRGLRIGDATCVGTNIKTVILPKLSAIAEGNGPKEGIHMVSLYLECIPKTTRLEFQLTADYNMLSLIGIKSIDDIFSASREFISYNHDLWHKVFADDYSKQLAEMNSADLWLGGGTGFLSKTLVYALAPDDKKDVAKKLIARYLDNSFTKDGAPMHDHVIEDRKLSPRALKLIREDMEPQIMGLCRIVEV